MEPMAYMRVSFFSSLDYRLRTIRMVYPMTFIHVRRAGATTVYPFATADSARDFANIEAYVANTGDDLDLDPTGLDLSTGGRA